MNREILRLAIPNILSNISIPLLSTVDTLLMGKLSLHYLGAIGIGSMIFNFIYWNFGFLRMTNTGMTAQAYGADDKNEIAQILFRSLACAIFIALVLIAASPFILELGISLMEVQKVQIPYVETYFSIRVLAAPASLGLYCLLGWLFGVQNAIYPLFITILINVTNIVLSAYFVKSLNLNIAGVAWGTVIAQYFGLFFAFYLIRTKYKDLLKWNSKNFWDPEKFKKLLLVNKDVFLRTLALTLVISFLTSQASGFGSIELGIHVVLMQFFVWLSYGIDGFAYASESLTGKYFGAKDPEGLKSVIKHSFINAKIVALFYSAIYYFFFDHLFGLFSNDPYLLGLASEYKMIILFLPLAAYSCFIWDGIYIGLTLSRPMRITMGWAAALFFVTFYSLSLGMEWMNLSLLWTLFLGFLLSRTILQTFYYRNTDVFQSV